MADSTLATFRIEQSLWDEFKTHCSQNGDSASGRLLKLIMADMGKSETLTPLDGNIDKRIESYLESHLDKLIDKVSRTEIDGNSLQRLDKRIDRLREEITCINVDELLDSRIDHKIKKAIDLVTDHLITREKIEKVVTQRVYESIATYLEPITDKLTALSIRLKDIESEIGGKYTVPIDVESSPVEPTGITASTLAPIFDENEIEPITDDTLSNEDYPIEENLEGLEDNLGGQSIEVTEDSTLKIEQIAKVKRFINKAPRRKLAPLCREINKQYNARIPSKISNNGTADEVKQALIDILDGDNDLAKQGLIDHLLNL